MVEAAPAREIELFKRLRDRFDSDEKTMNIVNDIILSKRTVYDVPTQDQARLMSKRDLMKVLYYCPESDYFYDSEDVMKDMELNQTRPTVFKIVEELINRIRFKRIVNIIEVSNT